MDVRNASARSTILLAGLFIAALGLGMLTYAYFIYPSLTPSYSGSLGCFELSKANGYTYFIPVSSRDRLQLTVSSNATVQAWLRGVKVGEGQRFSFNLPPGSHVVSLVAEVPAEGEVLFTHEPPLAPAWLGGLALALGVLLMAASRIIAKPWRAG